MKITIKHLRLISLIEGVSYLLLLFIGMPLKYGLGISEVNMFLGQSHGLLSIIFLVILLLVFLNKRLSFVMSMIIFVLSLIPFGALYAEKKLRKLDH